MLGQSFSPIGDPQDQQRNGAGQGVVNPIQEAIKVLSLKMPRAQGAGQGPIPQGLLTGPGMAGLPSPQGGAPTNPLEDLLRKLLGGMGGGLPAPRVIPGIDEGEPGPGTFNPGLGFPPEDVSTPPAPQQPVGRVPRDRGQPMPGSGPGSGRFYSQ